MLPSRTLAITTAVVVFVWPILAARLGAPPSSYVWLTGAFGLTLGLTVILWPARPAPPAPAASRRIAGTVVALVAGTGLGWALVAWVSALTTQPYNADMLIVIREGTRRLLDGFNPYTHYQTYDAPWDLVLPYGPLLWGPYLAAQASRTDLRVVTVIGELAVPVCVAFAAVVEAGGGRFVAALAWLGLLAALVSSVHLTQFSLMGHTPAYWPLFPLLAWLVSARRWPAAALVLGGLIVARSTMVALVPILLAAVWFDDRSRLWHVILRLALLPVLLFGPFLLWDAGALWETMVTSYPRIVKSVVWVPPARGVVDTIGVTGWLVSHQLGGWAEVTQGVAMLGVWAAGWRALARGAAPLPWMAVALAVFSMTALWPVFYLYFDVILLLASGAAAEVLVGQVTLGRWVMGVAATAVLVVATTLALTEPYPAVAFDPPRLQPTFALPRRSSGAAMIVVDLELPADAALDTTVTATLNGRPLWRAAVGPGRHSVAFPAPASHWWRGFNRLDLTPTPASRAAVHRIAVSTTRR